MTWTREHLSHVMQHYFTAIVTIEEAGRVDTLPERGGSVLKTRTREDAEADVLWDSKRPQRINSYIWKRSQQPPDNPFAYCQRASPRDCNNRAPTLLLIPRFGACRLAKQYRFLVATIPPKRQSKQPIWSERCSWSAVNP